MVELLEKDIKSMIYTIRGQQVMLDSDLARLYGYTTTKLNQQVKNNSEKFVGDDFMFQLDENEYKNLMSKNLISSWGGRRKLPNVFTEQGIYMLMTVLKGELAIQQSRLLVRTFKEMRHYMLENKAFITNDDFMKLSLQTNQNTLEIQKINTKLNDVATKDDISRIMDNFIDETKIKEFVFVDGQKFEANEAYISIYR
ncbi:MAG: ORF6N domain-containing protein, partial [Erysipelotrichales bacterium]|nr:ORF6N domain-containing protein [Erysipelotrichales bacterium]